ncbi:MAG TPA: Gfo/Idh/MocA family oxidoreductase [Gemmatimonadota bacterium]|nr:Gfo/Idh/MocA family oxidoreductase [Gemmatimonadota bacterium]
MVRIAVLGAGRIAEHVHLPNLRQLPGVVIEGVVDPDAKRRRLVQARWADTPVFESLEDLLGSGMPDALVVCTPPEHHVEAALRALSCGTHLYLEKPIATRTTEARAMAEAWSASTRIAAMGFNYRFHPGIGELARRFEAGEVGARIAIRTLFSSPEDDRREWRSSPSRGGGALVELGSHHLDLIRHVTGEEVREVTTTLSSRLAEGDTAFVTLALTDESIADCLFVLGGPEVDRFEIIGERGILSLDRLAGRVQYVERHFRHDRRSAIERGARLAWDAAREASRPAGEPSYRLALGAFVRAVRGSPEQLPSLADGLRALELAEAAVESARTRKSLLVGPAAEPVA